MFEFIFLKSKKKPVIFFELWGTISQTLNFFL